MTRTFPPRVVLAALLTAPLALAACGDGDGGGVQEVVDPAPTTDGRADPPVGTPEAPGETDRAPGDAVTAAPEHEHVAPADGEAAAPEVVAGVQVVEIEAGRMGYQPRQISLEAGVPARLVFTRTVDDECSSQITLPAYDVPATDLPLGEPVAIEFTPTEVGEVQFVCGMDMQRGTIAVVS